MTEEAETSPIVRMFVRSKITIASIVAQLFVKFRMIGILIQEGLEKINQSKFIRYFPTLGQKQSQVLYRLAGTRLIASAFSASGQTIVDLWF